MPTIERQIDALGGAHTSPEYGDGYSDALTDCLPIAADADALVEELIEVIEDVLYGRQTLSRWAADAEAMLARLKHRRAAENTPNTARSE